MRYRIYGRWHTINRASDRDPAGIHNLREKLGNVVCNTKQGYPAFWPGSPRVESGLPSRQRCRDLNAGIGRPG